MKRDLTCQRKHLTNIKRIKRYPSYEVEACIFIENKIVWFNAEGKIVGFIQ